MLIQHSTGHNTVIDISNGQEIVNIFECASGNHNQKSHPVNPIEYLNEKGVKSIFRFILTHPDMDHMDGIKTLFENFEILNFWDTKNTKVMDENSNWNGYKKEDWDFYQEIRQSTDAPKTLNFYAGQTGQYYNENEDKTTDGDGLYLLAPTTELVNEANETEEYNDCSYVILYKINDKKIIFSGDSGPKTWDYILENYEEDVTDVDLLIAPHHGRKTGGNEDYLDVLNPKLTLFGNAKSKFLDYNSWNNRNLEHITNNQAGCVIVDTDNDDGMDVYVTYEIFAKKKNPNAFFNETFGGWYIMTI